VSNHIFESRSVHMFMIQMPSFHHLLHNVLWDLTFFALQALTQSKMGENKLKPAADLSGDITVLGMHIFSFTRCKDLYT